MSIKRSFILLLIIFKVLQIKVNITNIIHNLKIVYICRAGTALLRWAGKGRRVYRSAAAGPAGYRSGAPRRRRRRWTVRRGPRTS